MIVVAEVRGEKEEEEHKGVAMDVVTKAVEARREGEEEEEETREKKGRWGGIILNHDIYQHILSIVRICH